MFQKEVYQRNAEYNDPSLHYIRLFGCCSQFMPPLQVVLDIVLRRYLLSVRSLGMTKSRVIIRGTRPISTAESLYKGFPRQTDFHLW